MKVKATIAHWYLRVRVGDRRRQMGEGGALRLRLYFFPPQPHPPQVNPAGALSSSSFAVSSQRAGFWDFWIVSNSQLLSKDKKRPVKVAREVAGRWRWRKRGREQFRVLLREQR